MTHPARIRTTLVALTAALALLVPARAAFATPEAADGSSSTTTTTADGQTPPTDTPLPDDAPPVMPSQPADPSLPPPAPIADSGGPPAMPSADINAQAKRYFSKFADAAKQVKERQAAAAEAAEKFEALRVQVDNLTRDTNDVTRQKNLQQKGVDELKRTVNERAAVMYVGSGQISRPDSGDPNQQLTAMREDQLANSVAQHDKERTDDLDKRVKRLAKTERALTEKMNALGAAKEEARKNQEEVQKALAISQIYFEQTKSELGIIGSDVRSGTLSGSSRTASAMRRSTSVGRLRKRRSRSRVGHPPSTRSRKGSTR